MKQVYHTIKKAILILVPIISLAFLSSCGLLELRLIPTPTFPVATSTQPEIIFPSSTDVKPTETAAQLPATATITPPASTPTSSPTPSPTPRCVDQAGFVNDVSVLDNTLFSPGETFIKTWRIKNKGTCVWNTNYSIYLSHGDLMGGKSPTYLAGEVKPGEEVDISVEFVAPATAGTYKGNWMFQNDQDIKFGLGDTGTKDFWVQIRVGEGESDITNSLGNPTWIDTMSTSDYWYLLDTKNSLFTQKEQWLEMKSLKTGQNDEWGMSSYPSIKNFYLEVKFITSPACGSLDRYGVLFRAPDFDRGYVAGFSCDGRYRLYLWDGSNYIALQEWITSNLIKPGPNQTNRLGVWANGQTIRLYANGQLIKEFSSSKYTEGGLGLTIGSVQTENFIALVDEVQYWDLSQQE